MTNNELKERFNLRYNNALEGAPGLDDFEISSYLTISQEEKVKEYYDIDKDPTSSFELKERSRRVLSELVKNEVLTTPISSTRGLVDDSKFFELNGDPMFIVLEFLKLKSTDKVYNGKIVDVKPITHDDFLVDFRNPFRKPNKNKAWRVDISKENSKTVVEIIAAVDISQYQVRYISFPSPIVLTNFEKDEEFAGLGLTVNGVNEVTECKLSTQIHNEIVDRAVELACLDYNKSTDLQARVSLNNRI